MLRQVEAPICAATSAVEGATAASGDALLVSFGTSIRCTSDSRTSTGFVGPRSASFAGGTFGVATSGKRGAVRGPRLGGAAKVALSRTTGCFAASSLGAAAAGIGGGMGVAAAAGLAAVGDAAGAGAADAVFSDDVFTSAEVVPVLQAYCPVTGFLSAESPRPRRIANCASAVFRSSRLKTWPSGYQDVQ